MTAQLSILTPALGARDECRTAPDGCRPSDQADRLEPYARLYSS